MKFNLKNKPKKMDFGISESYFTEDVDSWFLGFEKELREKIVALNKSPLGYSSHCDSNREGMEEIIKEILGE